MSSNDSVEAAAFELHKKAWSDHPNWSTHLVRALLILKSSIDSGESNDTINNNYAAVLLDLNRNSEALNFLTHNLPSTKSGHANMAIAIAKNYPLDISKIRQYNKSSSELPEFSYSITAYMDWQGL